MANRLLRNIAVTIGTGLAVGLNRQSIKRQDVRPAANLNPILNRLNDIEHRVARVENAPPRVVAPSPEEIEALGTLVSSQTEDIESLRKQIRAIERRNAEQVEAFGHKLALVEQQVPAQIEARVGLRMTELEDRLRGEFEEIHAKTVDAFVKTIESRVVGRIGMLENSLVTQAQAISTLREKTLKTDESLEKLLTAVERLCAKAEGRSQVPLTPPPAEAEPMAAEPSHSDSSGQESFGQESFAAHYERAVAQTEILPPVREPANEAHYAYAAAPSLRREAKSFGLSLIGLAILGLRLIR